MFQTSVNVLQQELSRGIQFNRTPYSHMCSLCLNLQLKHIPTANFNELTFFPGTFCKILSEKDKKLAFLFFTFFFCVTIYSCNFLSHDILRKRSRSAIENLSNTYLRLCANTWNIFLAGIPFIWIVLLSLIIICAEYRVSLLITN